ncbi:hypothetical protein TcCL_ESM02766 [Trypanosoma cruzi]|nr:hypothetical protein TcCL_ESM02766 [Trypanosoma cruzi]
MSSSKGSKLASVDHWTKKCGLPLKSVKRVFLVRACSFELSDRDGLRPRPLSCGRCQIFSDETGYAPAGRYGAAECDVAHDSVGWLRSTVQGADVQRSLHALSPFVFPFFSPSRHCPNAVCMKQWVPERRKF